MHGVGVRHDQLGERVELELVAEAQARRALQVVEAVAVLQLLELLLEHEVEGRAQQAAERRLLLGEAADPEVDVVDAGRDVIETLNVVGRAQIPVAVQARSRRSAPGAGRIR